MLIPLTSRFQGAILGSRSPALRSLQVAASQQALWAQRQSSALAPVAPESTSAAALVAVPLMLLHYDEPEVLAACLAQELSAWLSVEGDLAAVQTWGHVLASNLRGEAAGLSGAASGLWAALLAELRQAIAREQSFANLLASLRRQYDASTSAIAAALYCDASTPTAPALCCARAARTPWPLTVPLTAALVGARHGWHGLPLALRQGANPDGQDFARELLRAWAGQAPAAGSESLAAIAPAGRLQARPSFRPLAQAD